MCGISGYIGQKKLTNTVIKKTLFAMKNRGPDNQAFQHEFLGSNNLYLLSSRLKIVDRTLRSNQPMKLENTSIIYNGEIYNLKEIKKIIRSYGLKLKTTSDTELILQMYKIFGTECVNYFEGMWSFAIFDQKRQIIFISRDRLGEKPLYFYKDKNNFFFGSETKFIRILMGNYKKLNKEKIFKYLQYGYKSIEQSDESFFRNIFKLNSGNYLIIKKNLEVKKYVYWKPKIKEKNFSENKCKDLIKKNFENKIKEICNTDLKIGLSLSGGIDSNFILSFLKKK